MKVELLSNIKFEDITVLVAGPIVPGNTFLCIQSIRRWLPGARIVFSTWNESLEEHGDSLHLLDFDDLVSGDDPGGAVLNPFDGRESSIFRVVQSYTNALQTLGKGYVLKIRSDLWLESAAILSVWEKLSERQSARLPVFERKVLVLSQYTRDRFPSTRGHWPAILHLSDWLAFGLASDVGSFFGVDVPENQEAYASYMSPLWPKLGPDAPYRFAANFQFPPEMCLGLKSVGSRVGISLQHWLDQDGAVKHETAGTQALVDNFIVLPARSIGVRSEKYWATTKTFTLDFDYATTAITGLRYRKLMRACYPDSAGHRDVPVVPHDYWVALMRLLYPFWRLRIRRKRRPTSRI